MPSARISRLPEIVPLHKKLCRFQTAAPFGAKLQGQVGPVKVVPPAKCRLRTRSPFLGRLTPPRVAGKPGRNARGPASDRHCLVPVSWKLAAPRASSASPPSSRVGSAMGDRVRAVKRGKPNADGTVLPRVRNPEPADGARPERARRKVARRKEERAKSPAASGGAAESHGLHLPGGPPEDGGLDLAVVPNAGPRPTYEELLFIHTLACAHCKPGCAVESQYVKLCFTNA